MSQIDGSGDRPPIQLHHRLRIAREHAGLDQGELADLIGVARTTVGNNERGSTEARRITVNAWAESTGVDVDWLLNGDDEGDER